MKQFDYSTAINQMCLNKTRKVNSNIRYERIPEWVRGNDFLSLFLPYLTIKGDSREQNLWIKKACEFYGIYFYTAKKDKDGSENLKEGDYTFIVSFGDTVFDFTGIVAYERKGAISELFNNCTGYEKEKKRSDRDRIKREFGRFIEKKYEKVVLLLEFGECLTDLIDLPFSFRGHNGEVETKNTRYIIYSSLMSWKQPNNKNFQIIQSNSHEKLFWLFIQDAFYYFRNFIRQKSIQENLIEEGGDIL